MLHDSVLFEISGLLFKSCACAKTLQPCTLFPAVVLSEELQERTDGKEMNYAFDDNEEHDECCERDMEKLRLKFQKLQNRSGSGHHTPENVLRDPATLEPLRDLSKEAVWSVSTAKPGNGVEQLLDSSTDTYWQSDGPQPHLISAQFSAKFKLSEVLLYLSFEQDESYTPAILSIRVGSSFHDLRFVRKDKELMKPQGWVRIPLRERSWEDSSDLESLESDEDDVVRMTAGELAERDYRRRVRVDRRRAREKAEPQNRKLAKSSSTGADIHAPPDIDDNQYLPGDHVVSEHADTDSFIADNSCQGLRDAPVVNANECKNFAEELKKRNERRNKDIVMAHMIQIVIHRNHQNGRDSHVRQVKVLGPAQQVKGTASRFSSVAFQSHEFIR